MFRDILLGSRAIFIGVVFFVLCVGGSLLYSWHAHRTTDAEFGKRPQPVVSIENRSPSTNTAPVDFQTEGVTNTPEENTDTPMSDTTEALPNETENFDMGDAFLPDDFVAEEEAPAEEVPVSPYGFGPYPEVPTDYSLEVSWEWDEEQLANMKKMEPGLLRDRGMSLTEYMKEMELMSRVGIKLWNEGRRDIDGMTSIDQTGLFYPNEPDILYVEWSELELPNGEVQRYMSDAIGSAIANLSIAQREGREPLPDWIEIRSMDEGINPYDFLGLPR